jgi:uncharacterized protein (TIGR02265 family)
MPADSDFSEPPWDAPLDVAAVRSSLPAGASIAGMFFLALVEGAQRRQVTLAFPRARYLQFGFYPVSEFVPLLVEAAQCFHPDKSLRQGLRRIGTVGPQAFLSSTLGRVTLGASDGVHAAVSAIAKTYAINIKPSSCEVLEARPLSMIVRLSDVPYFLDSHHVGVFEGTLQYAGVDGDVRIRSRGPTAAELLLEWSQRR